MTLLQLKLYRDLKTHGATFERAPAGKVSALLPEGVILPWDLDVALVEHQGAIGDIALATDLKEPCAWSLAVALAELRAGFNALGSRLMAVPDSHKERVSSIARPGIDQANVEVGAAFRRASLPALRLALLEADAALTEAIEVVDREVGA